MRRIALGLTLGLFASFAPPASGQDIGQDRMPPRFLLAAPTGTVPLDIARTPVLVHRFALDLDGVPLREALRMITTRTGLRLVYNDDLIPVDAPVHLRADNITAAAALTDVLLGAGVDIVFRSDHQAVLVKRAADRSPRQVGTITGSVRAAEDSGLLLLRGAQVAVEELGLGGLTDGQGRFRIEDVPVGRHEVTASSIGYHPSVREVNVVEGEEVAVDFTLEVSAVPLDAMVVSGTAFETRMRTLPNPITLITAEDIRQKGATNLTDLLRGEIPGVFAMSRGEDDTNSLIYARGNAGWGASGDLMKIYIDGIEVASARYVSTIDPKNIERIEVVRGPQASAIYGSEAASGVVQIFTKKGTTGLDRPRIEVQAVAGMMESEHAPDGVTPLTQDYSVGVSGGDSESVSYRMGASWVEMGEWVKNYDSKMLGLSGGLRAVQGPLTAELTALWSDRSQDRPFFDVRCQYPVFVAQSANNAARCDPDAFDNRIYTMGQSTMGLNLMYRATPSWQHNLILGYDENRLSSHQPQPNRLTARDTFTSLSDIDRRRRSIRYNTAYQANLSESLDARITLGADYWLRDTRGSSGSRLLQAVGDVRTSSSTTATFTNRIIRNSGYFGLAELGWRDQLYLTLATRVEDMRPVGEDYGRPVQPRVGASYVRELGQVRAKLRAQWGKGVRLPPERAREGTSGSPIINYLPNPLIGPEEKVGWDAGAELYWGRTGSLALTRYEEEGENLIMVVQVDHSALPFVSQYQNIGVVGSEGWELEGTLNLGRVSLEANYAYADNRILRLSNQYEPGPNQQFQVGDRMFFIPKHSGGGKATLSAWRGSVGISASVFGPRRNLDTQAYYDFLYSEEGPDFSSFSLRDYYVMYPALWRLHLRAEQAVTEYATAFLRVDNLLENQAADLENFNISPGRTSVLGVRLIF